MDRERVGGKVRGNYKRYVFKSAEEALAMKKQFANQAYNQSQPQECYRPSPSLYQVTDEQQTSSIYMSCGSRNMKSRLSELGLGCLKLVLEMTDVLRHLIKSTFNHHFPTIKPNSS